MQIKLYQYLVLPILIGTMLGIPAAANSAEEQHGSHKQATGVVIQKAGALAVQTPEGATYQLNTNMALRKGQDPFKEGDEVTVLVDENNMVIDMHLKGQKAAHQFVTGKLVYIGQMKKGIKLQTSEGDKEFPLERLEVKTGGIPEGTMVTVEVNEAGTVIDLHRADKDQGKR
ncbi:MAG: hypothetical protein ACREIH_07070 [Nitrospiraceae bacterium]